MTITDGMMLWIGKVLADIIIGVTVIVSLLALFVVAIAVSVWSDRRASQRKMQKRTNVLRVCPSCGEYQLGDDSKCGHCGYANE